jgi:hypothetical protein
MAAALPPACLISRRDAVPDDSNLTCVEDLADSFAEMQSMTLERDFYFALAVEYARLVESDSILERLCRKLFCGDCGSRMDSETLRSFHDGLVRAMKSSHP